MSHLYKRSDSPFWYYSHGTGKDRVVRNTGQTTKTLAKLKQDRWDRDQVLNEYAPQNITLNRLYQEYILKMYKRKSNAWAVRIRQHLNNFLDYTGDRDLKSISIHDMDNYIDHRMSLKMANKTVREEISSISAMFRYAISHDYLVKNPCLDLILPDNIKKKPRTAIPYPVIDAILDTTPWEDDRIYWSIMAYTGLRAGDAGTL